MRIRMLAVVAAAVLAGSLLSVTAAEASTAPLPSVARSSGSYYELTVEGNPRYCLSVAGEATYGLVVIDPCSRKDVDQYWRQGAANGGGFTMLNADGACLGVDNGSVTKGTQLYAVDGCSGITEQWAFEFANVFNTIQSTYENIGLVAGVKNGQYASGQPVILASIGDGTSPGELWIY